MRECQRYENSDTEFVASVPRRTILRSSVFCSAPLCPYYVW